MRRAGAPKAWFAALISGIDFAGRVIAALPGSLFRRPGETLRQFERVAWGSLPLLMVAGASVGLVTWIQTHRLLSAYSLDAAAPGILVVIVVVESGPMLASLLIAGRMGAGFAAELGSMGLTEELDARTALGAAIIPTIVAPRVWACALAVPLLTIVFDAAALAGAIAGEWTGGRLAPEGFIARSLEYLELSDAVAATLKTSVFGALIAIAGCGTGLAAERSTEAIGKAATRGVVATSLAVFIANAILTPWLQAIVAAFGVSS